MDEKQKCSFCNKEASESNPVVVSKNGAGICLSCVERITKKDGYINYIKTRPVNHKATKQTPKPFTVMTPSQIKNKLDEYVIGQESAKIALSVAVYNHYKRISQNGNFDNIELKKSNILMCGPTGSGKTYLAQTISKILDVPFIMADATSLTASGYVGEDVSNILVRLLNAANNDIEKAKFGIVYIDEIDKISARNASMSVGRDVGTEGVQQELLKMLEGAPMQVYIDGRRGQKIIEFDTTNVLFICGGAFAGIEDVVKQNTEKHIGFGLNQTEEKTVIETKTRVTAEDLVKYGMFPEMVGRLPVVVTLEALDKETLVSILTKPKGALIKQYQTLFKMDGVDMDVTKEALDSIAEKALKRNMGARGLQSIMEAIMEKGMFEIPDMKEVKKVVITKETVESGEVVIEKDKKKSH